MMRWLRSFGLVAGALAVSVGTSACGGGGGGDDEAKVRIAVCGPMTGSAAAFGEMIARAAKMKESEINEAGGITLPGATAKVPIEVVIFDDKGDATEATNVARKVAADASIAAIIGHFNSNCSNAAKEEYGSAGIAAISPGSTNVDVCRGSPYMFRNLYRDDFQGEQIADYIKEALGHERAAVLYDNDDYGKGLMEAFRRRAEEIGLEVSKEVPFLRERTQDFKPLVQQAKESGAQAVFVAGLYNDAALVAKAARDDLAWDVPLVGGDGVMSPTYISIAGDAAEGAFVTTPFLFNTGNDTEAAKAFMASFEETYETAPDTWAALTYDALGMMLRTIEDVGTGRDAIRDELASITDEEAGYVGVTGVTYFDEEGDCYSKPVYVATVKDGDFVPAEAQLTD